MRDLPPSAVAMRHGVTNCARCGASEIRYRSVCRPCYDRARHAGDLDDLPPLVVARRSAEVVAEWDHLGGDRYPDKRTACEAIAPRLGMTPSALSKAIQRHKRKAVTG